MLLQLSKDTYFRWFNSMSKQLFYYKNVNTTQSSGSKKGPCCCLRSSWKKSDKVYLIMEFCTWVITLNSIDKTLNGFALLPRAVYYYVFRGLFWNTLTKCLQQQPVWTHFYVCRLGDFEALTLRYVVCTDSSGKWLTVVTLDYSCLKYTSNVTFDYSWLK